MVMHGLLLPGSTAPSTLSYSKLEQISPPLNSEVQMLSESMSTLWCYFGILPVSCNSYSETSKQAGFFKYIGLAILTSLPTLFHKELRDVSA